MKLKNILLPFGTVSTKTIIFNALLYFVIVGGILGLVLGLVFGLKSGNSNNTGNVNGNIMQQPIKTFENIKTYLGLDISKNLIDTNDTYPQISILDINGNQIVKFLTYTGLPSNSNTYFKKVFYWNEKVKLDKKIAKINIVMKGNYTPDYISSNLILYRNNDENTMYPPNAIDFSTMIKEQYNINISPNQNQSGFINVVLTPS